MIFWLCYAFFWFTFTGKVLVFGGGLTIAGANYLFVFLAVDGGFMLFKCDIVVFRTFPIMLM
jgi:hypothetical protein